MQDMLKARDIVTAMSDDIEVLTHASIGYMQSLKLNIGGVSDVYANTMLRLIGRIESAVNILDDEDMISQYPVEDQAEFKEYLTQVLELIDKNKKAINNTKDMAWVASNI